MTPARETKPGTPRKPGRPLLVWTVGVTALAAGAMAGWFLRDFLAVNACLDAYGAWTAPGVCVGAPPR